MGSARILVVEDEGIVALDIRNRLTRMGFDVVGVTDTGEEAIILANASQPDLILMDIRLKGALDGIQAAQQIREFSHVRIIYLTASADLTTVQRAEQIAPAPFLLKPFDIDELKVLMDSSLSGK